MCPGALPLAAMVLIAASTAPPLCWPSTTISRAPQISTRYSNNEQISEAFIKNDFRWHARIRTTENDCKRVLTLDEFCPSLCGLVGSHTQGNRAGIFIAVCRHILSFIN